MPVEAKSSSLVTPQCAQVLAIANSAEALGDREHPIRLYAAVVPLLVTNLTKARSALPPNSPQFAKLLAQTGKGLLDAKAWTQAEVVLREALATREAKEPDAWTTFNTKSMLGGALLGQKKYAEAEPLLKAGYEGMKKRAEKLPPGSKDRLAQALDRLIELPEATNKPDDAKKWEDEKAKLPGAATAKPGPEKK